MQHTRKIAVILVVAFGALAIVPGCRDDRTAKRPRQFFPGLDDQPSIDAQSNIPFYLDSGDDITPRTGPAFVDGRAARLPVPGTVAFGRQIQLIEYGGVDFADRNELLQDDQAWSEGRTPVLNAGGDYTFDENGALQYQWIERMPVAVTEDFIRLGQEKYNIYCLPCHGGTGLGDGLVGVRWAYPPTRLTEPRLLPGGENGQDGWIFHTIRRGVANPGGEWALKMPAYARKLSVEESWAIVAYIRALQLRINASPDMLDQRQRLELDRRRSASAPAQNLGSTALREDAP